MCESFSQVADFAGGKVQGSVLTDEAEECWTCLWLWSFWEAMEPCLIDDHAVPDPYVHGGTILVPKC